MPSLDDLKRMADKQAEPLVTKLKADPKNVDLLFKTALTYKAAHQFKDAITYFQKALEIEPRNVPSSHRNGVMHVLQRRCGWRADGTE